MEDLPNELYKPLFQARNLYEMETRKQLLYPVKCQEVHSYWENSPSKKTFWIIRNFRMYIGIKACKIFMGIINSIFMILFMK